MEKMHSDGGMCEQGIIMQTMYSDGVQRVMVRRADASMFLTQRATNFRKIRANTARGRKHHAAKKKAGQRRMLKEKHRAAAQSAVSFGSMFPKVRTRKLDASLVVKNVRLDVSLVVGGRCSRRAGMLLPLISATQR